MLDQQGIDANWHKFQSLHHDLNTSLPGSIFLYSVTTVKSAHNGPSYALLPPYFFGRFLGIYAARVQFLTFPMDCDDTHIGILQHWRMV
jgi:hypothetical protein